MDKAWVLPESWLGCYRLLLRVDGLKVAYMQICSPQHPPNRTDRVKNADVSRDHFGEHRLEDEIVFFVDKCDIKVVAFAECLLQVQRRIDAPKTSAENHNTFPILFFHRFCLSPLSSLESSFSLRICISTK